MDITIAAKSSPVKLPSLAQRRVREAMGGVRGYGGPVHPVAVIWVVESGWRQEIRQAAVGVVERAGSLCFLMCMHRYLNASAGALRGSALRR